MKYFLDTEFYEKPGSIDLISIGIVSENGDTFYAEVVDCNKEEIKKDDWLNKNVIPNLKYWEKDFKNSVGIYVEEKDSLLHWSLYCEKEDLKSQILIWLTKLAETKPEFYGYYCDYDWVVFCWLFGRMKDLPRLFPMYCKDLKQTIDEMSIKEIPDQEGEEHNALNDALYIKDLYNWIEEESDNNMSKIWRD